MRKILLKLCGWVAFIENIWIIIIAAGKITKHAPKNSPFEIKKQHKTTIEEDGRTGKQTGRWRNNTIGEECVEGN